MSNPSSVGATLRRVSRLAVLAGACVCAWAPAQAANLVGNASFDSGLSGWTTTGSTSWLSSGVASLADDASAITWTLSQAVAVSDISDFSLAAQNSSGVFSLVVLGYSDGSSSGTDVMLFDLGNDAWTRYSLSDQLAAGKALTSFTVYGNSSGATLLDEVSLATVSSVPEPGAAWLALAGGTLLLPLARRRRRA